MRLEGKTVILTDASSPVGRAVARRFALEGARLALNFPVVDENYTGTDESACTSMNAAAGTDMNIAAGTGICTDTSELSEFKDTMSASGHITVSIDPASKQQVDGFVEDVMHAFGKIDALVHGNNDVRRLSLLECTDDEFMRAMDVNAKSAFLFTQAAGRRMKDARAGHILYMSTIHDEKPTGAAFAYSISKGAVQMLMREAAVDLGVYGICVNSIGCGPVEGDDILYESDISKLYENLDARIPMRHVGTPEDFASLALFLCGDENRFINGEDIRVDGGFLLNYGTRMNYEEYNELLKEHNGDIEALMALYAQRRR